MKPTFKLVLLLLAFSIFSCEDEPVDNTRLSPDDPILVDSELYNNIERVTTDDPESELICIDFDYAFTINVFNEEEEFLYPQIVGDDGDFSDFLGNLPEGYIISVSYPISYTNDAGESINITNNNELKALIDVCIELEVIEDCNGLLTEEDCIWTVLPSEDVDNTYVGAYFDISEAGIASFHFNGEVYFGTWITLFIEEELHINIFFQNDDIGVDWNFDWKVTISDDNNMAFEVDERIRNIERTCSPVDHCSFIFEECEETPGSEQASFDLEGYIDCFTEGIDISNSTITFHETLLDLENGTNALSAPYTNVESPQFIFVRLEDNTSGEANYLTIQIVAIECEE